MYSLKQTFESGEVSMLRMLMGIYPRSLRILSIFTVLTICKILHPFSLHIFRNVAYHKKSGVISIILREKKKQKKTTHGKVMQCDVLPYTSD